ncbi:MAG TPA: type ISP restriction/modification enzyme, partial [Thermoanaerobaculia bacterium]|nr:type ISP restriction/modification enzyme [Thermoanaerobaculia bacterium]
SDLGVEPDSSHRPAIFLTNALTGWEGPEQLKLQFPELQDEHDAARRVKREEKIIVILGNPPYNRFAGVPPLPEESDLADHYKGIHRNSKGKQAGKSELFSRFGIRKHLLDDLYVRFFRLAEVRIGERAEHGVVSFISNYSFLTGRSHPLMRESLLKTFDDIWVDSLNGDKYRTGKVIPVGLPGAGASDQSVFSTEQDSRGIQVGAAITTLLKRHKKDQLQGPATVHFRDFWGLSAAKRQALLAAPGLASLPAAKRRRLAGTPEGPREYETVLPAEKNRWKLVPRTVTGGFEDWPSLDELFPVAFQGVNPNRGLEGSLIDTEPELLASRMRDYYSDLPFSRLSQLYPTLCKPRADYAPEEVRESLLARSQFKRQQVVKYLQFPLDLRFIYYETQGELLNRRRPELWENLSDNLFLATVPEPRKTSESRPLIATTLFDLHVHDRGTLGFPLRIRRADRPRTLFSDPPVNGSREANLAEDAWRALRDTWSLAGTIGDDEALRIVRTLFSLTLALAHAPQYEADHKDTLSQDWIHLPIPKNRALFEEIGRLGETVGTLLDPAAEVSKVLRTILGSSQRTLAVVASRDGTAVRDSDLVVTYSFFGVAQGAWRERRPQQDEAFETAWGEATGDLHLNDKVSLRNVPERVWRYELGGYPVIKKWLGYRDAGRRPGQPLTLTELQHLREMVHRIAALLLLHSELDTAYERALEDPFTADELRLR